MGKDSGSFHGTGAGGHAGGVGSGAAAAAGPGAGAGDLKHRLLACTAGLDGILSEAADINPGLAPVEVKREALVSLTRLADRVEGLRMAVIAGSGDVAEVEAARSVADWVAAAVQSDRGPQAAAENLAHDLDRLYPTTQAALFEGVANLGQVRVVVRCLNELRRLDDVTDEILSQAEAALLAECSNLAPRELRVLGDRILEIIDPTVFEEAERKKLERDLEKARAESRLSMRRRGDGSTDVHARVPDALAVRLKTVLEAFTSPRHDANTAKGAGVLADGAVASRYRDPATGERLPHERMLGEAFCAFLERHDPIRLPKHGGMATTLVITTEYDALTKQLSNGTLPDGRGCQMVCVSGRS